MFTIQHAINILLLLALVKVLKNTHNPTVPAFIYATATFIYGNLAQEEFMGVLIASVLSFGVAFFYFWLLNKFEDSLVWWLIFISGLFIGLL